MSDIRAVKANWWQENWSGAAPAPNSHSTPSGWGGQPATFATELSNTHTCSHTLICVWVTLEKENIFHRQTKQSELCLPLSWDFNPNIQKRVLPTFFPPLLFFFFREIYLRHAVAQGHQKTRRSEAMDKRQQQQKNKTKWGKTSFFKKKKKKNSSNMLSQSLCPAPQGGWRSSLKVSSHPHPHFLLLQRTMTGWPHGFVCVSFFSFVTFFMTTKKNKQKRDWTEHWSVISANLSHFKSFLFKFKCKKCH